MKSFVGYATKLCFSCGAAFPQVWAVRLGIGLTKCSSSKMNNGKYRTPRGSEVIVSGEHSGRFAIGFDWFEEDNACIDCEASIEDGELIWSCDGHEGSSAPLTLIEDKGESNG